MSLFAARANPRLSQDVQRSLARLASELLPDATSYDIDLIDLIRFSATFADQTSPDDRESRARRAAGAAFLHAGAVPRAADRNLIARGNVRNYNGDPASKLARDTWAYMVYKRTKSDDRRRFYSYKPGAEMRDRFCEALIKAIEAANETPERFHEFVRERRRQELNAAGIEYSDKRPGIASTSSKIDRSTARDVNYPDGSIVGLGQRFTKTWSVTNIGQVAWIGRRLMRVTPQSPTFPSSPDWIAIPDTFPGETVLLSVEFQAGRVQGFSEVRFKMTDDQGTLFFPNKYPHGLTLIVDTENIETIERSLP